MGSVREASRSPRDFNLIHLNKVDSNRIPDMILRRSIYSKPAGLCFGVQLRPNLIRRSSSATLIKMFTGSEYSGHGLILLGFGEGFIKQSRSVESNRLEHNLARGVWSNFSEKCPQKRLIFRYADPTRFGPTRIRGPAQRNLLKCKPSEKT